MYTMQEAFDKACQSVIKQGCKSSESPIDGSICLYRGPNGLKCAIGHLINDEQMVKFNVDDGCTVRELDTDLIIQIIPEYKKEYLHVSLFLDCLQIAHDISDNNDFVNSFKENANIVAKRFNLKELK